MERQDVHVALRQRTRTVSGGLQVLQEDVAIADLQYTSVDRLQSLSALSPRPAPEESPLLLPLRHGRRKRMCGHDGMVMTS
jgi:hypothetical protein